jgi:hypothetical protein
MSSSSIVSFSAFLLRTKSHRGIVVTNGNHTATESTFSNPCVPAHVTNVTINGFDSGFRDTQPGTVGSILPVPIIIQNENHTFWFYDYNTCGEGGVGVINNNESSVETLAGFVVRVSVFVSCRVGSATHGHFFYVSFSQPYLAFFWGGMPTITLFFQRNAVRLNGTHSSESATSYRTSSTTQPLPSASARKSGADRSFNIGVVGAVPLFIAGLFV